jgi:sec-independent protein translocase protein TatC
MGAVTIEQLTGIRPYFIVGSFVIAAIVTPPDVLSQLLLAVPMCVLYEVGIVAARVFGRPRQSGDDEKLPETGGEPGL